MVHLSLLCLTTVLQNPLYLILKRILKGSYQISWLQRFQIHSRNTKQAMRIICHKSHSSYFCMSTTFLKQGLSATFVPATENELYPKGYPTQAPLLMLQN